MFRFDNRWRCAKQLKVENWQKKQALIETKVKRIIKWSWLQKKNDENYQLIVLIEIE